MAIETTYTQARAAFASLCDAATDDRETIIVHRRGKDDVAIIAADELRSLEETAHLLSSPRNAERIFRALARSRKNEGTPQTIEEIRREFGLEIE